METDVVRGEACSTYRGRLNHISPIIIIRTRGEWRTGRLSRSL